MPINNITQTISTLPPAGARGVDVQTQFVIKQEDFQDHLQGTTVTELNTLKDQLNLRIGEINSTATTMNGYANTASAGASTATTKAGEASTSASEALAYRNQAETFKNNASTSATKASQWADNNYNVEVEAGKYSAKHWATVAQNTLGTKVDKVTSTDNAIVRFNGTTGDVQNSGVIIDDNNNVGIGVTPSGNYKIETPYNYLGSFRFGLLTGGNSGANYPSIGSNFRTTITSNSYLYDSNNLASMVRFDSGGFQFLTAPSGTAGNPIAWTNAMALDASGALTINSSQGGAAYWCQVFTSTGFTGTGSNPLVYMNYSNNSTGGTYGVYIGGGSTTGGKYLSCESKFEVDCYGNALVKAGTGGLGYGTGAGGTVTQLTSKGTAVVLNKPTGTIITHNATMVSGAAVSFSVINTLVSNTDTVVPSTSTTSYAYTIDCVGVANGSFIIRIVNNAASSLSENIAINFTIIKGANA